MMQWTYNFELKTLGAKTKTKAKNSVLKATLRSNITAVR